MTTLAIDVTVIAIVAFCSWRGYKNGLIRGVFGVVALIASLFIANIAAQAYSSEFTVMLKPFVSGVVETTITEMDDDDDEDIEEEPEEPEYDNDSEEFGKAYKILRRIGLPRAAAERIADITTKPDEEDESIDAEDTEDEISIRVQLSDLIADKLSDMLAYVAVFAIAFVLLAIIFAVIGNLISFVFSLPGLKLLDIIAGSVFGLFKGLIIVYTLAAIVRYFGLVALDILEGTSILNYIVNHNPVANILGI